MTDTVDISPTMTALVPMLVHVASPSRWKDTSEDWRHMQFGYRGSAG